MFVTLEAVRAQFLCRGEGHSLPWGLCLKHVTSVQRMSLAAAATVVRFAFSIFLVLAGWLDGCAGGLLLLLTAIVVNLSQFCCWQATFYSSGGCCKTVAGICS